MKPTAARLGMIALLAVTACSGEEMEACGPDALGTARTLTLPAEPATYGTVQGEAVPLAAKEIVLTFDDGPSAGNTDRVLDALAAECSKATFFMLGSRIETDPDLAARVVQEGHSVALHSHTHANMSALSPEDQLTDLDANRTAFDRQFGTTPVGYRFPFLAETDTVRDAVYAAGLPVISIDFAIEDWVPEDTTETLTAKLREQLAMHDRGIILLHDANPPTAEAIPTLLDVLKAEGYSVVHLEAAE